MGIKPGSHFRPVCHTAGNGCLRGVATTLRSCFQPRALQADFEQTMDARANEVLALRDASKETKDRRAHYAAVAQRQEDQLQVGSD